MSELLPDWFVQRMKFYEGFRAKAYRDGTQWSVGYGSRASGPNVTMTEREASRQLIQDLADSRRQVDSFVPESTPEGTRLALTSLTNNAGPRWMREVLGDLVKQQNWPGVEVRLQMYNKAGGQTLNGLVNRRSEEATWMRNGVSPSTATTEPKIDYPGPPPTDRFATTVQPPREVRPVPPGTVPSVVSQVQNQPGTTRKLDISPQLHDQINDAAIRNGLTVEVFSGGQQQTGPFRTGSTRHDLGGAADLILKDAQDGHVLVNTNPQDRLRMGNFIQDSVANGATGIGHGPGYMDGVSGIHVGGGTPAAWGAQGKSANTPPWVQTAWAQGRTGAHSAGSTALAYGTDVIPPAATPTARTPEPTTPGTAAPAPKSVFDTGAAPMDPLTGMRTPGTIDLSNRPVVRNPDGSISTVRSVGVNVGGNEVLLPTVSPQGTNLTVPQAVAGYNQTGDNLGTFYSPIASTNFAGAVSAAQGAQVVPSLLSPQSPVGQLASTPAAAQPSSIFTPAPDTPPPAPKPVAMPPPKPPGGPYGQGQAGQGQTQRPQGQAQAQGQVAAPARVPSSLADAIVKAMGPRGVGVTSYTDPNTGRQILNPGGSGEEAMGLTRDLGAPMRAVTPPAPQAASATPLPTPRPSMSPFDMGNAGPPPGPPYTWQFPIAPDAAADLAGPATFKQRFGAFANPPANVPSALDLSLSQPRTAFGPGPLELPAAQAWQAPPVQQPQQVTNLPQYQPTTVQQQMGGLSPFSMTAQPPLLPFQDWPPWMQWGQWGGDFGGWGGGGGGYADIGFAPSFSFDFGAFA